MLNTYRKLLALLTPRERRRMFLLLIMVIVSSILETGGVALMLPFLQVLSNPELIQTNGILNFLYTTLGYSSNGAFFMFLGAALFVVLLFGTAFNALTLYALTRFGVMRAFDISSRLLKGSLHQPYTWFLDRHSSALSTSVLTEVNQLVTGSLLPALQILPRLLTALMIIGVILFIEPAIALAAVVLLGGTYSVIFVALRGYVSRLGRQRMLHNKTRFRVVQEATGGIKELKLMGLEGVYSRRFETAAFAMARIQSRSMIVRQMPRFALELIAFGGMILLLLFLIARNDGDLSKVLPTVGFLVMSLGRLLPGLQEIYSKFSSLQFNTAVMDNIHDELRGLTWPNADAMRKRQKVQALGLARELHLDAVTYRYPSADRTALDGLTLRIGANTTVGLVGGTGAGKTTVVDIILGLLTPEAGAVKVDGTGITAENVGAWQKSIGYVPQQIFLTDASIASNIAFGIPPGEIDMAAVERAARIASLHDFIEQELPQGYETHVGEAGMRLSGGQRQRVGIARALYHDPDVLIMDEATSALDTLTEQAVMEAVHNIAGRKTIVMIAHRLSTVKNCDEIFVLQKGRVLASGPYQTLLDTSPEFRKMAKAS